MAVVDRPVGAYRLLTTAIGGRGYPDSYLCSDLSIELQLVSNMCTIFVNRQVSRGVGRKRPKGAAARSGGVA